MTNRLVSSLVATVIMLTLATGATWALQTETDRIAISELKQKLDSGEKLLLIDVREDWELEENGAIPGALHIPMAELDMRMKDIPKDIQLVFY
jgi:rhodanese-related sulfurtransferase